MLFYIFSFFFVRDCFYLFPQFRNFCLRKRVSSLEISDLNKFNVVIELKCCKQVYKTNACHKNQKSGGS